MRQSKRGSPSLDSAIATLSDQIARHHRITVLTGAGVSAASGVPTFRGPDGLWRQVRPESLATPEAFASNPRLVWEWYAWRRSVVAACAPNRAHEVLASWSRRFETFSCVTQNVDGLHERAGTRGVVRFHGSIWELQCWRRCASSPQRWRDDAVPLPDIPPRCPHCDGLARPGVVWFGESIDPTVIEQSLTATVCDLFLTIGTSSLVQPAAGLLHEAKHRGAFTVEVNVDATPVSEHVDLALRGPAEQILDQVERRLARAGR